jgi:hypothetical protein
MKATTNKFYKSAVWVVTLCLIASILSNSRAAAEEPPDLAKALVSYVWSWNVVAGKKNKTRKSELHFLKDGTATIREGTLHWKMDGQRTVRLENDNGKTAVINFDETFSSFTGAGFDGPSRPVHGERESQIASVGSDTPAAAPQAAPASQIENFADQLPAATAWISAPLRIVVPAAMGGTVRNMEEGLKDEAARTPQASQASYDIACHICEALTGAVTEREQIIAQNKQRANGALTDAWENQWKTRAGAYLKALGGAYTQFREAVRQSPDPEKPAKSWSVAALQFPPVTFATPAPAPRTAAAAPAASSSANPLDQKGAGASGSANPLDRGAYDKKRIWVPRTWSWWYY